MICEAFGISPEEAERQDYHTCMDIILMRNYATIYDREDDDPKSLRPRDRKFLLDMERMADGG